MHMDEQSTTRNENRWRLTTFQENQWKTHETEFLDNR